MPMFEADTMYYQYPFPLIPEIFHKVNGKLSLYIKKRKL